MQDPSESIQETSLKPRATHIRHIRKKGEETGLHLQTILETAMVPPGG